MANIVKCDWFLVEIRNSVYYAVKCPSASESSAVGRESLNDVLVGKKTNIFSPYFVFIGTVGFWD